jgi:chromosome segregation ATPase
VVVPMSARNDFLGSVRDNDKRRRDDSAQVGLQQQVDELRSAIRELTNRCARIEENIKAGQSAAAQDRLALEQHQHEVAQAAQARQVEEARVRQALSDLSTRIEDSTRPIRTLQAHVSELIETVRRFRDEDTDVDKRLEELRSNVDYLSAHHERQIVNTQALRDQIEAVRSEVESAQRDIHHTEDSVKVVDHEIRRRANELRQEIEALDVKFKDYGSVWQTIQVQVDAVREVAEGQIGRIDSLEDEVGQFDGAFDRIYHQTKERDDENAQRIEEVRQHLEHDVEELRTNQDQRYQRIETRIDDLEHLDRELGYRINILEMALDELRQEDARLRRELWYLHEQRVRARMEQIQEEMEQVREARREAERRAAIAAEDDNGRE